MGTQLLMNRLDRRRLLGGAGALALAGGLGRRAAVAKEEEEIAGFWARPQGAKGELIGYNLDTGKALFTLPPGQLAADGSRYLAAEPQGPSGYTWLGSYEPLVDGPRNELRWLATRLGVYHPLTGRLLDTRRYEGAWTLGGISATGRYAALTSVPTKEQRATWAKTGDWQTELMVVDLEAGPGPHRFTLAGNFEVEVLSAYGDALFLVEHLPAANPDHYAIRLYDLVLDQLAEGRLVDKRNVDQVMAGLAWDFVASPDGTWLLTLYLSTDRDVAFVHTLNLVNRYPVCIDLPSGFRDFDLLKHYTLALAPDNRRLYAANPALGAVAVIDLNETRVVDVASFEPASNAKLLATELRSRAAVGTGGRFYFTGGADVWVYDASVDEVAGPLPVPGPIIGLGLGPDERHVLVARPDEPLLALDPSTGAASGFPIASR